MERKLAAILAADVVGYSRLVGSDEEATIRRLDGCREAVVTLVAAHQGRMFGGAGDSFIAEFASPVKAVQCADAIQRKVNAEAASAPKDRRMQLRIGINVGDVIVQGENLLGDAVNVAARLEALAEPGGVCISGTVFDHVRGKLSIAFTSWGERHVKNIAEPVRVYAVVDAEGQIGRCVAEPTPTAASRPQSAPDAATEIDLSLPDRPSIAVLPFTNLSTDPEQEYFSDGIAEDIITALSKISNLLVVARNSTFTYKGKAVEVRQVGREQGVRYVLEGSVRKAGKRVRVTAQLIDAQSGLHVWAERYDRNLEDIFAIQDEITREVVLALDVRLAEGEQVVSWSSSTKNLEAWECFRRSYDFSYQITPESTRKALALVKKALTLDPNYARAWVALGWMNHRESDAGMQFGTATDWHAKISGAEDCARKALEIDPSCTDAYALLGVCHLWRNEHDQAISTSMKAAGLAPNHSQTLAQVALVLNKAGQPERALDLIRKAMRLCPIYPAWYLTILGTACRLLGQTESAVRIFRQAVERDPERVATHAGLASALGELGRAVEAKRVASEILRLAPDFSINRYLRGLSYRDPADLAQFELGLRKAGLPD